MAASSLSIASSNVGLGSLCAKEDVVVPTRRSFVEVGICTSPSLSGETSVIGRSSRCMVGKRCGTVSGSCEFLGVGVLGVGEEREVGIGRKGWMMKRMNGGCTSSYTSRPKRWQCLARSSAAESEPVVKDRPAEKTTLTPPSPKRDLTVVMKFGGSSVSTSERMMEVADLITSFTNECPVIVLSAMGKTTHNLLKAGTRALEFEAGNVEDLHELNLVSNLYLRTADDLGVDRNFVAGLLEEISQVLMGVRLLKELSAVAKDRLISLGECLTARLFVAYLDKLGVKACQIDISNFGTKEVLRDRLEWSWERDNAIPIATGSFGKGGSDMAATVIAEALRLKEIQVWEVVDGGIKGTPQLVAAKTALYSQRVVHFDKYHGLGNDFLLVDNTDQAEPKVSPEEAQRLCDRKFGVGGDGVIFALPGPTGSDFAMRIYNSDGSEPEMCGNGIRCMAKFVHGLNTRKKSRRYVIDTLAGPIIPVLQEDGQVRVDMGSPTLNGPDVPTVLQPTADGGLVLKAPLQVAGKTWSVTCVSMGNPHCITFGLVGPDEEGLDVASLNLEEIGPQFERHPAFPARTNTEFVQVLSRTHLRMRVWERGAGPTLACGTGACALVVAAVLEGRADRKCRVDLPGGPLEIEWSEEDNHVYMTGPAVKVYEGKAYL